MTLNLVSLLLIAAVIAGLIYYGISATLASSALEAARRENEALKARRDALREEALTLGAKAGELLERGRQLAPSSKLDRGWRSASIYPPAASASNESIIAWITDQGTQLEALAVDLSPDENGDAPPPDARRLQRPGVDHGVKAVRQHEPVGIAEPTIAEPRLRRTGDSS